jgi:hypothetical protein
METNDTFQSPKGSLSKELTVTSPKESSVIKYLDIEESREELIRRETIEKKLQKREAQKQLHSHKTKKRRIFV